MRRTRGKGPSVPYARFEKLWSGIGLNYLELRQNVIDDLISLFVGFSTYKYVSMNDAVNGLFTHSHRNLRFVATASLLSFLRGLAELEHDKLESLSLERGKKKVAAERELARIREVREQLYMEVICHRIRDVYTPIRELATYYLGMSVD